MLSVKNSSLIPLASNRVFIGSWDNVIQYNTAIVSVYSDTNTLLTVYQSQNKTNDFVSTYNLQSGVYNELQIGLTNQYVYFTLLNQSQDSQTFLNLSVIYRNDSKNTKGSFLIWDNANTGLNGVSQSLYIGLNPITISCYGNISANTTLRLQQSNDNITFYDTQYSVVLGSSGDFGFNVPIGVYKYIRFTSSIDVIANIYVNYS